MKKENLCICNVCGVRSDESENLVFIQAVKNQEQVDICTACIPSVIHGSGGVVRSNDEIAKELGL